MKALLSLSLLISLAFAQQDATFTVKKSKQAFKPGFYCSDYMTDGRACYYFDTLGTVRMFNSPELPDKIPAAFAKKPNVLYSAPYTYTNDTLRFKIAVYLNPGDFNPVSAKQTTTVVGTLKDDMIRLTAVTDVNGRVDSRKETFVRLIHQP